MKKTWKSPELEVLDVSMTMFIKPPKEDDEPSPPPGESDDVFGS